MKPLSGQTQSLHGDVTTLEDGRIYDAVVVTVDLANRVVAVKVHTPHEVVNNVIMAAGVMAALLGFRESFLPPVGTNVVLLYGRRSYILGCVPGPVVDPHAALSRTITGETGELPFRNLDMHQPRDPLYAFFAGQGKAPADLLEGEYDLSNLQGVGLSLLTHLARLAAGDRAKVECLLLEDMVRIVSHQFRHLSSFGEYRVIEDGGRVTVQVEGSGYEHETWNAQTQNAPKLPLLDNGQVDFANVDALQEAARWRYSQFLGFLGDFVNEYVTDPLQTIEDELVRSGRSRVWRGTDGTVLIQSVAEIAFERVVRISVPLPLKRADDPSGNKPEDMARLDPQFLRSWDFKRPEDMFHAVYQLRHYARWLGQLYSLARFHQLDEDWKVPAEADVPSPSPSNQEEDRAAVSAGVTQVDCYATFRIMRDGSIVTMDAHGSAAIFANGNVQVSAARHLFLEAAGDLTLVAGQDINLKARRNIEIWASRGGLVLRARAWLQQLCEWGSLILESKAVDPLAPGFTAPTPESPEDPSPVILPYGIAIDSQASGLGLFGRNRTVLRATAATAGVPTDGVKLEIDSADGALFLRAKENLRLLSLQGYVLFRALKKSIVVAADSFLNFLYRGIFDVNNRVTIRPSGIETPGILARFLSSAVVFSRKITINEHGNHVSAIPAGAENSPDYAPQNFGDRSGDNNGEGYSAEGVATPPQSAFNLARDTVAAEITASARGTEIPTIAGGASVSGDTFYTPPDELYQSPAQQRASNDTTTADQYDDWLWSDDTTHLIDKALPQPWPGQAPRHAVSPGGQPLETPDTTDPKAQPRTAPVMQRQPVVFKFLKRSSS